jgi:hypothetical protein
MSLPTNFHNSVGAFLSTFGFISELLFESVCVLNF